MRGLVAAGLALCLHGIAVAATVDVEKLRQLVQNDASFRVRLQAVAVLSEQSGDKATLALIEALSDGDAAVRGLAVSALAKRGDRRAILPISRLSSDGDLQVRRAASAALASLSAKTLHFEIGGIGSRQKTTPEMTELLRHLLADNLGKTPGISLTKNASNGYFVDGAITEMSQRTTDRYVEVNCEVRLTIGKIESKAIFMTTSAGATVQTPRRQFKAALLPAIERDALTGAVEGVQQNLQNFVTGELKLQKL